MGLPSPTSDYVETRIDLNKVCHCTGPASRLYIAEQYHGMHINSCTMLLIDPAIKPVDGNLLLAQINGDMDVWRLVIEGVVTHIIYDARNDVFDDPPCI